MERAGGDALAHTQLAEATGQLACRLASEGEGQHAGGIGAAIGDPVGDAPGEHPGLPGPRAGQDAEGAGRAGDGCGLCRVQALEQGGEQAGQHRCTLVIGGPLRHGVDRTEGV